jgi:general secretion pathway protein G
MFNRLMERKRQEEGFTLIELLIVVIILGILAAIVIFGVSTFRDDSVKSACKTDLKSVETAAEAYKTKTGAYPADTATPAETAMAKLVAGKYLKAAPVSDDYTISLASGTGAVSGDLTGGSTTTNCSA